MNNNTKKVFTPNATSRLVVEETTLPFFTSQKFPFDIDDEDDLFLVESLMNIHS